MHGLIIPKSLISRERRRKISSFVAAMLLLVIGRAAKSETAVETAAKMSLEQKVGQVMIWSFHGTEFTPNIESVLTKYQLGAVIFFGRNIRNTHQIAKLNSDFQKLAARKLPAPLFLMVDQEGGMVTRVKISTPVPSALALGNTGDPALIQSFAKVQGDLIQALGFNVNLAPVVDVSAPDQDSFIGNRVFGGDPQTVANLAQAYSRGMQAAGILPTAKHFPGHGGEISDSHQTTPQKMITADQLMERDLIPFKEFAAAKSPRLIMTAHLALPNIDESGLATTFSSLMIKTWLREKLKFAGLVITDDLEMTGAAVSADAGERAIRAFLAGHDMVMLAGSFEHQKRAFTSMIYAVKDGRIPESRLTESVVRILEAKQQMRLASSQVDERKAALLIRKLRGLSKEVMERNFKMAMGEKTKEWPSVKKGRDVLVFSSTYGFFSRFQRSFKGRARHYVLNPESLQGAEVELGRATLGIFYASGSKTAHWLNSLDPTLKAKLIVVNCNHPAKIADQDSFLTVLNLNSHSPDAGEWLATALSAPRPPPESAPQAQEPAPGMDNELPPAPLAPGTSPPDTREPAGDHEALPPEFVE